MLLRFCFRITKYVSSGVRETIHFYGSAIISLLFRLINTLVTFQSAFCRLLNNCLRWNSNLVFSISFFKTISNTSKCFLVFLRVFWVGLFPYFICCCCSILLFYTFNHGAGVLLSWFFLAGHVHLNNWRLVC